MDEKELAHEVVDWLKVQGWDVYQEVQPKSLNRTADIVAVNGKVLWIIECKTSLSLTLLEQALRWQGYGNYISIAIPTRKKWHRGDDAARLFLKHFGIGMLSVKDRGSEKISQVVAPHLYRERLNRVKACLNENQKTYAEAGNAEGRRWTPFQQTCLELLKVVREYPGIHFKEAMGKIAHHYNTDSTAKTAISRYLREGNIIKGVYCERDGKYLRLYERRG